MSTAAPLIGLQVDASTTVVRRSELQAGPPLADVAPHLLAVDVVGAFGLLGREHAAHEPGGDRCRPAAGRVGGARERSLEAGGPERGDDEAAETDDRAPPGEALAVVIGWEVCGHERKATQRRCGPAVERA